MSILAKPILFLFYSGSYTAEHLTTRASCANERMTIGLFTMVQATSGILQGCGKQRIPMYTLLAGVACKVLLNFLLVRIPALNIHGAPIASLVCYTVSMAPNLYYVVKYAARRFPVTDIVLRPLAATLAMGAVVWLLWQKLFTESYPFRRTRKANDRRDRVRGRRHCGVRCVRGAVQGRAQRGSACPPAPPRKALKGLKPSCIR